MQYFAYQSFIGRFLFFLWLAVCLPCPLCSAWTLGRRSYILCDGNWPVQANPRRRTEEKEPDGYPSKANRHQMMDTSGKFVCENSNDRSAETVAERVAKKEQSSLPWWYTDLRKNHFAFLFVQNLSQKRCTSARCGSNVGKRTVSATATRMISLSRPSRAMVLNTLFILADFGRFFVVSVKIQNLTCFRSLWKVFLLASGGAKILQTKATSTRKPPRAKKGRRYPPS